MKINLLLLLIGVLMIVYAFFNIFSVSFVVNLWLMFLGLNIYLIGMVFIPEDNEENKDKG
jgi:predicted membrane channel-forming protein YqfA (hemolysin III family)